MALGRRLANALCMYIRPRVYQHLYLEFIRKLQVGRFRGAKLNLADLGLCNPICKKHSTFAGLEQTMYIANY